jgi:hypothetical protein
VAWTCQVRQTPASSASSGVDPFPFHCDATA